MHSRQRGGGGLDVAVEERDGRDADNNDRGRPPNPKWDVQDKWDV